MTGDPSDIGRTPECILISDIKNPLEGLIGKKEITGSGVEDPFGFSGRSTCIKDKEGIFGIHDREIILRPQINTGHFLVPPAVPALFHLHARADPPHNNACLDLRAVRQGLIGLSFQWDQSASPKTPVGRDKHPCTAILHAVTERSRTVSSKDDAVDHPQAGASQHGNRQFRHHGQIHSYPVPFLDAMAL